MYYKLKLKTIRYLFHFVTIFILYSQKASLVFFNYSHNKSHSHKKKQNKF